MEYFTMPTEITKRTDLTASEKLILGILKALDNSEKHCYASNQYIADLIGLSKGTVANIMSQLAKKKFITVKVVNFNERTVRYTFNKSKFIPYDEYLQTDHWKQTRQAALKRAKHKCQLCNSKDSLNVHHNNYDCLFHEKESDLIVLCKNCHSKFHDKLNNKEI